MPEEPMQIIVSEQVGLLLRTLAKLTNMTNDQIILKALKLDGLNLGEPPKPLPSAVTPDGTSFRTREASLPVGLRLRKVFKGQERRATVEQHGIRIEGENRVFLSPSLAAVAVTGYNTNGWVFWEYLDQATQSWKPLDQLRQAESNMQPYLERLKQALADAPRSREFLSEYVRELEMHRREEDIFIRLAFRDASAGGAFGRGDTHITSVYSELYDRSLDANQKREIRLWWHDRVRREAEGFADLRARLAKLNP